MDITVLSLAGSTIASVKAEPGWLVSAIVAATTEQYGKTLASMKLIFKGQVLEAQQQLADIGLNAGAVLYAVCSRCPPPGKYSGCYKDVDRESGDYVHMSYVLTISAEQSFILQRMVMSSLTWVCPDATFTGVLTSGGDFGFDAPHAEDQELKVGSNGTLQLRCSVDTTDGDIVSHVMTLYPMA